jgi:hypothetical protein
MFTPLLFSLCVVSASNDWIVQKPVAGANSPAGLLSAVEWREGAAVLQNRGTLLSKESFEAGLTLECTWKWTKGSETGKYHDHLCICLATDGRQRGWSHEITEGILIRFNPGSSAILVSRHRDEAPDELLATTEDFPMARGTLHKLKIVDDGKRLEIYFDDLEKPALVTNVKVRGKSRRVAIYNREPVAGDIKESVLANLTIRGR